MEHIDRETFCCSICLDLLKDPVTIPCGHSYCMGCIKAHWDGEDQRKLYTCPQCRQCVTPRPVLVKNTILAHLVEELKKSGLPAPVPADHCYAGPEDVACDVCTGRKLKAVKFCLVCVASYCKKHIQSHFDAVPLKKHKLVFPSVKLRDNICSRHDEVMKMFCRTDQQCICYLCSVENHKGHNIVSAATERTERQRELEASRQKIQEIIQGKENGVKVLQLEAEKTVQSADKAVENSDRIFTELLQLLEKVKSDVRQQIRSQQETEVAQVKELQEKLEQEIAELRRKDAELEKLPVHEDDIQFLKTCYSLSHPCESSELPSMKTPPFFDYVTAAVSEVRDKLQRFLSGDWANIAPETVTQMDVSPPDLSPPPPPPPQPEPRTRSSFLKYARKITLDPNTPNKWLSLSEGNKRVRFMKQRQNHPDHPDRFNNWPQVLGREGLTGRCYWEVEGFGSFSLAVAYKDIKRSDESFDCSFGQNDKSWSLNCGIEHCGPSFRHNSISCEIPGPLPNRIGVYLDHGAGILSFYDVFKKMTLLYSVQTTFTQPLYAGLELECGATAKFTKLK